MLEFRRYFLSHQQFQDTTQFLCKWYFRMAEFHLEQGGKDEAIQYLQNGFEPLDILEEDRTPEEEKLWREIRNRLRELLPEIPLSETTE